MKLRDQWATLQHHPPFRRKPLRGVWRRALWTLYRNLFSERPLLFRTSGGFMVMAYPRDVGSGSLFYDGQYEYWELQHFSNWLERKSVVLDIGANIGIYTLLAATRLRARSPDARIVALEPNPFEFRKLCRNVEINHLHHVTCLQMAAGDRCGAVEFCVPPLGKGVFGHIRQPKAPAGQDRIHVVPCTTIDRVLEEERLDHVGIAKIDVEGHELAVLRGAKETLEKAKIDLVIMEIGHGPWQEAVALLQDYGYGLWQIEEKGRLGRYAGRPYSDWCSLVAVSPQEHEQFPYEDDGASVCR